MSAPSPAKPGAAGPLHFPEPPELDRKVMISIRTPQAVQSRLNVAHARAQILEDVRIGNRRLSTEALLSCLILEAHEMSDAELRDLIRRRVPEYVAIRRGAPGSQTVDGRTSIPEAAPAAPSRGAKAAPRKKGR